MVEIYKDGMFVLTIEFQYNSHDQIRPKYVNIILCLWNGLMIRISRSDSFDCPLMQGCIDQSMFTEKLKDEATHDQIRPNFKCNC